jgi:RNA polymerase sigma-70 factor (ECF subfamily)
MDQGRFGSQGGVRAPDASVGFGRRQGFQVTNHATQRTKDRDVSLSEPELKALMLRSLDGDASAYRRLLTGLRDRLHVYFGRRLASDPSQAEDLVQETLMAIHAKRATFDRKELVTPWAYAIARYKLIDHFRRTGRGRLRAFDHDDEFAVDDESAAADARRDIERGLEDLPSRTRDLVISVKLHEEPVSDIARRTGMSETAVKVAVHRGFLKLAARLRGKGHAS